MQFILFTNRLRWIAPFTIFIENFIVLKSLIGNRVKKSALKDADQKKKSSMRDFYCNYAHFWFLFLGGLDCVFFLWVGWNQEVLSLYWSRGDVQQSFLSWILERLHDLTVLLLGGLLLVLFSFFVCTFHFLNNPNACNIAKKKSHLLMNLPENIWRRRLSSLRPPAVYLKRKKKKMYIFRSVISVIFLVTYTRDSSSSFFPPLIWSD